MELMASTTSAQRPPTTSRQTSKTPLFYSRYHTEGISGIDVWRRTLAKYRTPENLASVSVLPPSMVGVLISHIQVCCARAVIIVPDTKASWFPLRQIVHNMGRLLHGADGFHDISSTSPHHLKTNKQDPPILFQIPYRRHIRDWRIGAGRQQNTGLRKTLLRFLLSPPLDGGGAYLPHPGLLRPGSNNRDGYKSILVPTTGEHLGPNQNGSD